MADYSIYPNALDGYSQLPLSIDKVTEINSVGINRLRSAIVNIEKEIGILPSGSFLDLVARLDNIDYRIDSIGSITLSNAYRNDNSLLLSSEYGDFKINGTEGVLLDVDGEVNITSNLNSVIINSSIGSVEIDGASNMGVLIAGLRKMGYGTSTTPPTLASGSYITGDNYYHSLNDNKVNLYYDSSRAKWLSEESIYIHFGRSGTTIIGQYYNGISGVLNSATTGFIMPQNGTIVSLGYTRADNDSADFKVMSDGLAVATVNSVDFSGFTNSLNADVSAGSIISVMNDGINNITGVIGWLKIKLRG